jgi:hypothetical protein
MGKWRIGEVEDNLRKRGRTTDRKLADSKYYEAPGTI